MLLILFSFIFATADEFNTFKTGKHLNAAMAVEISWFSVGAELDSQLLDLQSKTDVAILRDRRIDPHQLINVKTEYVPRVQVLKQISAGIPDGAFCLTKEMACIGPAEAILRLPILLSHNADQVNSLRKKMDSAAFRRLTAPIDGSWGQLSEPRQILLDHAKTIGAVINNPETIPHDVWAEKRVPRMSFSEIATVILNQFDLTFELTGDKVEFNIVPINLTRTFEYRYTVGSKLKSKIAELWQTAAPDIQIQWTGSNATVITTLQQHAALNAILQEVQYAHTTTGPAPGGSIRTTNYELKEKRATIGLLIRTFRSANVPIEVLNEDSPDVQAIFNESIELTAVAGRNPGAKFFPLIFGTHFKRVEVLDDRIMLSRE